MRGVRRMAELRLARAHERLERALNVLDVGRPLLVDDHEIHGELLQAPVLVRAQQLAHDLLVPGIVDPNDHDRDVARYAVWPEDGAASGSPDQELRRLPQRRIEIEDAVGETLEEMRLVVRDAEVMELHLGSRAGEGHDALEGRRVAKLVREIEDDLTRRRHQRGEGDAGTGARLEADARPHAEDRIEHRARRIGEWTAVD